MERSPNVNWKFVEEMFGPEEKWNKKMKKAIYPGSFNPWHQGHTDILKKALKIYDTVVVAHGFNPDKGINAYPDFTELQREFPENLDTDYRRVWVKSFAGLLVDFVNAEKADAVIRGLRNGHDLQYEMNQQYWNEDLGLVVPTVYFICDRRYSHISSSAIRALNEAKKNGKV